MVKLKYKCKDVYQENKSYLISFENWITKFAQKKYQ